MRNIDVNTAEALSKAPEQGIVVRNLVWIRARRLTDPLARIEFAFWNELDTLDVTVVDAKSGLNVTRTYVGGGTLLDMEAIPLTSDLTVRTIRVPLSQVHDAVQDMARGSDLRHADVQIHRAVFNPHTRRIVGPPRPHFVGRIDRAPIGTPTAGQEGSVELECVSDTRELTRSNAAKKSDEFLKRRENDRFYKNCGTADVPVYWGSEKARKSGK